MKLTLKTISHITLFENVTGAKVKDCIQKDNGLIFIIEEGSIQRAARGLRKVEHMLKKPVKIIGHSEDLKKFITNLIYPEEPDNIRQDEKIIYIETKDNQTKGRIFGRSRERLQWINELVKKYFDIDEVRVA